MGGLLETTCVSNLTPNHTLQLNTCEETTTLKKEGDTFVVIFSQMFSGYYNISAGSWLFLQAL